MKEGAPQGFESNEAPKAISFEKKKDGSILISVSQEIRDQAGRPMMDHFMNIAFVIRTMAEKAGLLESIDDIDNGTIVVRPFNPTEEIPENVQDEIEAQIQAFQAIF